MTDTTPNVPRELLEVIEQTWRIHYRGGPVTTDIAADAIEKGLGQLRALLSAPSPAGVDGLEVVAYRVSLPGEPELGTWLDEDAENEPQMCLHEPLCRLSDAQAIIDGLRGEVYDEEKERALFEATFTYAALTGRKKDGGYRYKSVQDEWEGWIKCAKSRPLSAGKEGK